MQDEQRELAKTICVSGSILLSTVSNFLDFFKVEAGKQLDVVRSEINIKVRRCAGVASWDPSWWGVAKVNIRDRL